jgi:hypothetical protein
MNMAIVRGEQIVSLTVSPLIASSYRRTFLT